MPPSEEWRLDSRRVGRRVLVFDRLDSTNSYAGALAGDPAHDGLAVLAREQSAGRGQYGRTWECPANTGVLLSVSGCASWGWSWRGDGRRQAAGE